MLALHHWTTWPEDGARPHPAANAVDRRCTVQSWVTPYDALLPFHWESPLKSSNSRQLRNFSWSRGGRLACGSWGWHHECHLELSVAQYKLNKFTAKMWPPCQRITTAFSSPLNANVIRRVLPPHSQIIGQRLWRFPPLRLFRIGWEGTRWGSWELRAAMRTQFQPQYIFCIRFQVAKVPSVPRGNLCFWRKQALGWTSTYTCKAPNFRWVFHRRSNIPVGTGLSEGEQHQARVASFKAVCWDR